jgi:uncharacterized membrane protein
MLNRISRYGILSLGALNLGALGAEFGLQVVERRLQAIVNRWWQTLVRITFGLFVGSLVALLGLLYGGAPIV